MDSLAQCSISLVCFALFCCFPRRSICDFCTIQIVTLPVLMLSATLTATDTISVLTLIKKKRFPRVHSIIFGEGIVNDSVALILYHISSRMSSLSDEINLFSLDGIIAFGSEFALVASLSVAAGLALCWLSFFVVSLTAAKRLRQTKAKSDS